MPLRRTASALYESGTCTCRRKSTDAQVFPPGPFHIWVKCSLYTDYTQSADCNTVTDVQIGVEVVLDCSLFLGVSCRGYS